MSRDDLAARQAALLAALVGDGPVPAGFDRARLATEADGLRAKRRRVLARLVDDDVVARLGDDLDAHLDAWVATHPRRTGTSSRDDAAAFTAHLRAQGLAPRHRRWWRR